MSIVLYRNIEIKFNAAKTGSRLLRKSELIPLTNKTALPFSVNFSLIKISFRSFADETNPFTSKNYRIATSAF